MGDESEVPVGLRITTPAVGGLSDCSQMEEIMIKFAGEPLLEDIEDEIIQCEKQVQEQSGLVYLPLSTMTTDILLPRLSSQISARMASFLSAPSAVKNPAANGTSPNFADSA